MRLSKMSLLFHSGPAFSYKYLELQLHKFLYNNHYFISTIISYQNYTIFLDVLISCWWMDKKHPALVRCKWASVLNILRIPGCSLNQFMICLFPQISSWIFACLIISHTQTLRYGSEKEESSGLFISIWWQASSGISISKQS